MQFADGIRPGDGTSPSAGEDLCSPPPSKVLPKEKRYTRTKLRGRNMKKKVKVYIFDNTFLLNICIKTMTKMCINFAGEDNQT